MKITVSGDAGCVAYVDGDTLRFLHLDNGEGWKTGPLSQARHIFIGATDLVELEVSDPEEALSVARRIADVSHALFLLELAIKSDVEEVAAESAAYLEDCLDDPVIRAEIEVVCFATPVPETVDMERVVARTSPPAVKALVRRIADDQPRLRALLNNRIDTPLPGR